jgi:hypothetical protein
MMTGLKTRGEDVRRYIIDNIEKYPATISRATSEHFKITRQAVNKHLQRLIEEKILAPTGNTKSRTYKLCALFEWSHTYELTPDIAEDVIWTNDIRPVLGVLPDNVMNIWHYGFTEMFNNAKDHSGGAHVKVFIKKTAAESEIIIVDDGVGIFKKIQAAMNLLDERHAVLELAKGKFTTDPKHHSGEGIFFTSRVFNSFDILSGEVFFSHELGKSEDWISEVDNKGRKGTAVWMKLHNHTSRTMKKIFAQFSSGADEYAFNKTIVPVRLAKYGDDNLISRSQAKRLLARVELFKYVILNFEEIATIGQAFADEIFRVFVNQHPEITLSVVGANSEVKRMIERAKSTVR